MKKVHIVTPVKNSFETTIQTIENIINSNISISYEYTVYNDFSADDTTFKLQLASKKLGFTLINLSQFTSSPSPNYNLILQMAQKKALSENASLIIVESDVIVERDTIQRLTELDEQLQNVAMISAITTDKKGIVNFPYLYAQDFKIGVIDTRKRLSFCCTLINNEFLKAYNYDKLNPKKHWFDVFISHKAIELGFKNYLLTNLPVVHYPHSSRPWKQLKYNNPLKYYWQKLTNTFEIRK